MKLHKNLGGGASRLAAIWAEFNSPGNLPDRRDFTLSRLGALASCFLVLRRGEGDDLVVVQSGTAIDHIWGRNVVGAGSGTMALRHDVNLPDAKALAALAQPCGIYVGRKLFKASGNDLRHETLYLPVTSRQGRQLVSVTDFADSRHLYGLLGDASPITGGEMYFAYFVDVGHGVPEEGHLRVA
ncbi:PAS domain-containing protein [Kordiimonas aestuarii]|uniref:hypothetical protein n=1 Tax=Kordiimonas aestuarii TaxID=1005925 RepID=UPI0021D28EBC|nr:hypothetical protein [Kordiimonas aestuarii]